MQVSSWNVERQRDTAVLEILEALVIVKNRHSTEIELQEAIEELERAVTQVKEILVESDW